MSTLNNNNKKNIDQFNIGKVDKFCYSTECSTVGVDLFSLLSSFGDDISFLSDDAKYFINSIITSSTTVNLKDIKKIYLKILSEGVDTELNLFLILVLIGYFIDNNFKDCLENLLEIKPIYFLKDEANKLLDKYKSKSDYIFVHKNIQGALFYFSIMEKKEILSNSSKDKFEENINSNVEVFLNYLNISLKFNKNHYLFVNYLLTLLFYNGYELLFNNLNEKNKSEIGILINKIVNDLNCDKYGNNTVYLYMLYSICNFYSKVVGFKIPELKKIKTLDYEDKNIDIDYVSAFLKNYTGLDVKDSILSGELVCYKDWPSLMKAALSDKEDKLTLYTLLSTYNVSENIKMFSTIMVTYLKNNFKFEKTVNKVDEDKIDYMDRVYYSIESKLRNMMGFDISLVENLVKYFLVQYLGLNVNFKNLDFKLVFSRSLHNSVDIPFIVNCKDYDGYNSYEIKSESCIFYFLLPSGYGINTNIGKSKRLSSFLQLVLDKILSLNNFLHAVDYKMKKLENKHPETLNHMNNISDLLSLLLSLNRNSNGIEVHKEFLVLKRFFPLKEEYFYKYLSYLHDIGKADNVDNMDIYAYANLRVDPYVSFLKILDLLLLPGNHFLGLKNYNIKETNSNIGLLDNIYYTFDVNKEVEKTSFEVLRKLKRFDLYNILDNQYYLEVIVKGAIENYPIIEDILSSSQDINLLNKDFYPYIVSEVQKVLGSMGLKKNYNPSILFLSILFLLKKLSKLQIGEITHPHITYGLHFFQISTNWDFLNFVLFHHDNYPKLGEIKEYMALSGLKKYFKLIGKDINLVLPSKDNMPLEMSKRPASLVMFMACDILDALLSGRKYIQKINILSDGKFESLKLLDPSIVKYINSLFNSETTLSIENTFDRVIGILDKIFSNNCGYMEVKLIILSKKCDIIEYYENKKSSNI